MLGRNTMEFEILREAPSKADLKKADIASDLVAEGQFAMKAVADTPGVPFQPHRAAESKPRESYNKVENAELLPTIRSDSGGF